MRVTNAKSKGIGVLAECKHGGTSGHANQKFLVRSYANVHAWKDSKPYYKAECRFHFLYKLLQTLTLYITDKILSTTDLTALSSKHSDNPSEGAEVWLRERTIRERSGL